VLSDSQRRATYDRYGHEGLNRGGYAPNFESFGSVADIFEAFFGGAFGSGGGVRQAGPAQGADVSVHAQIDLAAAARGTNVEVGYEAVVLCEHCHGNGAEPGTPIETCQRCNGTGQLRVVSRTPFGQVVRTTPCDVCQGDGRTASQPCRTCEGRGRTVEHVKLSVDIPAGIATGQRIRVAGRGHSGDRGGPPGDLYVLITVLDDQRFVRDGDDLLTTVDVSAPLAALGTVVEVPTVDNSVELEIPAGTQPHETLVIRGRGMPSLRGRRAGDLRVVVNVVIPRHLTREQRELTTKLAESLTHENLHSEDGVLHKLKRALGGENAARHRR
jgi:molecular chaperone DnaJ